MNFGKPFKIPDGRYFVKPLERKLIQLNNVVLKTPFAEGDTLTLELPESAQNSVRGVDQNILSAAQENSTEWFSKEVKPQTLEAAYTKSLSDTMMNVSKMRNNSAKAYSASKEQIDPTVFVADTVCDVVIEFVGVWFMKKTFGSSWRIIQMREKVAPKPKWSEEYLFEDSESEKDEEYP